MRFGGCISRASASEFHNAVLEGLAEGAADGARTRGFEESRARQ